MQPRFIAYVGRRDDHCSRPWRGFACPLSCRLSGGRLTTSRTWATACQTWAIQQTGINPRGLNGDGLDQPLSLRGLAADTADAIESL